MSKNKLRLVKLRISLLAAAKVFRRPQYIVLAALSAIVASGFILWSLNLDLVRYILFDAPISAFDKLDFFFDVYMNIYSMHDSVQGTGIVVFSILFGINIALLTFVLKHRGFKDLPKKSGAGGFVFAIIGGGCVACGTSLIAPLLATLGASATPLIRDISTIFIIAGSLLIMYSIYKLGAVCSYIFASANLTDV